MPNAPKQLSLTLNTNTSNNSLALFSYSISTTNRTLSRHLKPSLSSISLRLNNLNNLRNYIPSLLNNNRITNHQVLLFNKILIMKSSLRNHRTRNLHRLQYSHRRNRTSSTNLTNNILQKSLLLLRRILISNSPLWSLIICTQNISQMQIINLNNRTINSKR